MTFFNYRGYLEGIKEGAQNLPEPEKTIALTKYAFLVAERDFEDRAWIWPDKPDAPECQKYVDLMLEIASKLPERDRKHCLRQVAELLDRVESLHHLKLKGPDPACYMGWSSRLVTRWRKASTA
jgi:hypothetical protein